MLVVEQANDNGLNTSLNNKNNFVDRLRRIGQDQKGNKQKELQILAEESILARNMNNVILGSVLLPKGENDDLEVDDYDSNSSEDEELVVKDNSRFGHKTKSDY